MNLNNRPTSYFDDAITAFLSTIKGERRKREATDRINRGDVRELEDWLIKSKLKDGEREALGSIHPSLMGGEYLPDFLPGEVEIARISLESTTADVISVRARLDAGKHHYRIVDEYETEYIARPAQTAHPLTLGELIDLIDFAQGDGTESFVDTLRRNADPDGAEPDSALSFVTVSSDFYPTIGEYYGQRALEWIERRNEKPQLKYGLHKLIGGISMSRAMNIIEFASNKRDTIFLPETWYAARAAKLRALPSDPITADQAQALLDAALKVRGLDDVIEWLEHMPGMSWREYVGHKGQVAKELENAEYERRLAEHRDWLEELKAMPRPACNKCGSKDEVVPIIYGLPESPILPTEGLFVRGGCMVDLESLANGGDWHCKRCRTKVKFLSA